MEQIVRRDGNYYVPAGQFDPARAESWDTNEEFPFGHQTLHRTRGGRWVMETKSGYGDAPTRHELVDGATAMEWLREQRHRDAARKYFPGGDPRGPGRPEIGPAFSVRLGPELLERLDAAATEGGVSRAEMLRRIVDDAV